MDTVAFGHGSYVRISAEASDPRYQASAFDGFTGALGGRLESPIGVWRWPVVPALEFGGMFRGPRGLVNEQADVRLDGIWLGAAVGIEASL